MIGAAARAQAGLATLYNPHREQQVWARAAAVTPTKPNYEEAERRCREGCSG